MGELDFQLNIESYALMSLFVELLNDELFLFELGLFNVIHVFTSMHWVNGVKSNDTRSCNKIGIKHYLQRPGNFLGRDRLLRS